MQRRQQQQLRTGRPQSLIVIIFALAHRYAATDVTVNRSRLHPQDILCVGDRIQVHGTQTQHHGRIAQILGIGDRRVSVSFEDGLSGKYVEYTEEYLSLNEGLM
jgi:FKBP-type peptidyl-prolyl cis-trans isomerase 2